MQIFECEIYALGREITIYTSPTDDLFNVWLVSGGQLINQYSTPRSPFEGIKIDKCQLEWVDCTATPEIDLSQKPSSQIKSNHSCFNPIFEGKLDRKAWSRSKKEIEGTWKDSDISFSIKPGGEFVMHSEIPVQHVLSPLAGKDLSFWDYKRWCLSIGGDLGGVRYQTLGVVNNHLALLVSSNERMAHSFSRA